MPTTAALSEALRAPRRREVPDDGARLARVTGAPADLTMIPDHFDFDPPPADRPGVGAKD